MSTEQTINQIEEQYDLATIEVKNYKKLYYKQKERNDILEVNLEQKNNDLNP